MIDAIQNFGLQSLAAGVGYNLGPNFAGATVEHSHDGSLASVAGGLLPRRNFGQFVLNSHLALVVHILYLRAYVRFVYLNFTAFIAAQLRGRFGHISQTD